MVMELCVQGVLQLAVETRFFDAFTMALTFVAFCATDLQLVEVDTSSMDLAEKMRELASLRMCRTVLYGTK